MQVKKFEARTMKEALEMVKTQMGPDAIILSVRDNNKSFGLVGDGSIEITAAVSEETLQKKKFVESRLREQDRQKFTQAPARQQKQIITKFVDHHVGANQKPQITQRRYIEIEDESPSGGQMNIEAANQAIAAQRIKNAAQSALKVFEANEGQQRAAAAPVARAVAPQRMAAAPTEDVLALKAEIASLKQVISQFQNIPQSFAGAYPGADYGVAYDLCFMFEKLTQVGVDAEIAAQALLKAQDELPPIKLKNKALIEGWVAKHLLESTKIASEPTKGKIHCFFGPAGSGKTSTLVKMASHLVVREKKKVAIFTADTHKVGAAEQLKIYAQILNVPFMVIRSQYDWNQMLRYLANVDVVLVDCPSSSLKNQEEMKNLKSVLPPASLNPQMHLVVSAAAKDSDMTEVGRRYSLLGYQDVIFTSLDESIQHGSIYNFMKRFDIPLHSFGIGTRVPEDFEFATKERVLDLLLKITRTQTKEAEAL